MSIQWAGAGTGLCRLCAGRADIYAHQGDGDEERQDRVAEELEGVYCEAAGALTRHLTYSGAILTYTGIQVTAEDDFPKVICKDCVRILEEFDSYVEKCLSVQKYFEKISGTGVKTEAHYESYRIKEERDVPIKQEAAEIEDGDYSNSFFDNGFDDDEFSLPLVTFKKENKKKTRKRPSGSGDRARVKKRESSDSEEGDVETDESATYFSCDLCPRIVKTEKALERHRRRHEPKPERNFSCTSCGKTFTSKENLKSHERVHIPLYERYNYHCEICGNKFTTKSAVVGHTRAVHEKIKRYICDICGYACSTGGELVQHRAIHSDEKSFQCNRCPKKFKTASNLKAHLDTHDSTSYPCSLCEKVLNSRRTLRKHMLVHEDVCRHVCSFCNKAFKRRQTLKVHLTTHTGDTPIQCPWCPQKFAYSSACRTHKQRCHPDRMAQLASGEIRLPHQSADTISLSSATGVQTITVEGIGVQSMPVQTITLQNMTIIPSYDIEIPAKIEVRTSDSYVKSENDISTM